MCVYMCVCVCSIFSAVKKNESEFRAVSNFQ